MEEEDFQLWEMRFFNTEGDIHLDREHNKESTMPKQDKDNSSVIAVGVCMVAQPTLYDDRYYFKSYTNTVCVAVTSCAGFETDTTCKSDNLG